MGERHSAQPAIDRTSRKQFKLSDGNIGPMLQILYDIAPANGPTEKHVDALEDIRRAFRLPASAT